MPRVLKKCEGCGDQYDTLTQKLCPKCGSKVERLVKERRRRDAEQNIEQLDGWAKELSGVGGADMTRKLQAMQAAFGKAAFTPPEDRTATEVSIMEAVNRANTIIQNKPQCFERAIAEHRWLEALDQLKSRGLVNENVSPTPSGLTSIMYDESKGDTQ